jgi:hypothetical protein
MARGLMSWLQTAVAEEGKAEACPAADPTGPLVGWRAYNALARVVDPRMVWPVDEDDLTG